MPKPILEPGELPRSGYVRLKQLVPHLSVHGNTITRWVREGRFPAPVKLSARVTAWRIEDVRRWLRNREGHEA